MYQVEEIRPPSTKRKKRRPSTYPLKRPGLIIASKMAVNFMVPRILDDDSPKSGNLIAQRPGR